MNKFLTILKNRKVIKALIAVLAAIAVSYGYGISPEFQQGIVDVTCALITCDAPPL